jgi:5,6-dimethylbenzimidazole synthase
VNSSLSSTQIGDRSRYDTLMEVVRNRVTSRAFEPTYGVPREHYDLILEAARHAPSGANSQPWHFIVITDPELKRQIAGYFVD